MYAQAEEAAAAAGRLGQSTLAVPDGRSPAFVDDQPGVDAATERSSALRRLIGGLRRKDH